MTREEMIEQMRAVQQALNERIEVWRDIVAPDGTIVQRIYRGSFPNPRPVASITRRTTQ